MDASVLSTLISFPLDTKPEAGLSVEGQLSHCPPSKLTATVASPLFSELWDCDSLMELITKKQTFLKGPLVEDAGDTQIVTPKGAHNVGKAHMCMHACAHTHTHTEES